jgi:hypothetical protein
MNPLQRNNIIKTINFELSELGKTHRLTNGIKTYQQLNNRVREAIPILNQMRQGVGHPPRIFHLYPAYASRPHEATLQALIKQNIRNIRAMQHNKERSIQRKLIPYFKHIKAKVEYHPNRIREQMLKNFALLSLKS